MKELLKKRWFLILLTAGVLLSWFGPNLIHPFTSRLDPRWIVAAVLFLMASSLESRSLLQSVLHPLPALAAALISLALVPLIGLAAGRMLSEPGLRMGLLIISAVPCTLASAVLWTRLAQGSEATALLVVFMTTCLSWLTTTAWLTLVSGQEAGVQAYEMMQGLVLVLVLPVAVGQLSRLAPSARGYFDRQRIPFGVAARLLILSIILKAVVDIRLRTSQEEISVSFLLLAAAALTCLATHMTGLGLGFWSSRLLGFSRADQIAVAFASSQKSLPVALYLVDSYYKKTFPLALVPLLFYHIGQLVADTLVAESFTGRVSGTVDRETINNPANEASV